MTTPAIQDLFDRSLSANALMSSALMLFTTSAGDRAGSSSNTGVAAGPVLESVSSAGGGVVYTNTPWGTPFGPATEQR